MTKLEKVLKGLEQCTQLEEFCNEKNCPYFVSDEYGCEMLDMKKDAIELLKEQQIKIEKYKFVTDFIGDGFKDWGSLIADGKAEAICSTDDLNRITKIEFRML